MVREAVRHMHSRDFCYCIGGNVFVMRLITKKGDFEKVNYVYKDKYLHMRVQKYSTLPMKKVASDSLFDYYEVHYNNDYLASRYAFELISDNKTVAYYCNYHFYDELPTNDDSFFTMPKRMHQIDTLESIDWLNSGVVYQIFPDRFNRGSNWENKDTITVINRDGNYEQRPRASFAKWDKKPHYMDTFGGTINGIREKLDYIKDLGANIVYLTPIFESPSSHKYDTTNYMKIDPSFGSDEDFKQLVHEIHQRDMKIILDCVVDHCGYTFPMFMDLIANQENSQYKDWFHVNNFPIKTKDFRTTDIEGFSYFIGMPKLNVDNPEVRDYFSKMIHKWMIDMDIDGWRLDVADEVAHSFWTFFNREVKMLKPDAPIIGEVWYDTSDWLNGNEFDSTMNYPFFNAVIGMVCSNKIKPSQFINEMGFIRGNTNYNAYNMLWNLIDSHDSARFLHCCNGDKRKLKLAVLLQMTMSGTPMVYYGDEIGMTGGEDPDCRRGMVWDESKQDLDLLDYYKKLISLRRAHTCLYQGDMTLIAADDETMTLIYKKEDASDEQSFIVALNCSDSDIKIELLKEKYNVLNDTAFDGKLPAYSGVILV